MGNLEEGTCNPKRKTGHIYESMAQAQRNDFEMEQNRPRFETQKKRIRTEKRDFETKGKGGVVSGRHMAEKGAWMDDVAL